MTWRPVCSPHGTAVSGAGETQGGKGLVKHGKTRQVPARALVEQPGRRKAVPMGTNHAKEAPAQKAPPRPSAVVAERWPLMRLGIAASLSMAGIKVSGETDQAEKASSLARSTGAHLVVVGDAGLSDIEDARLLVRQAPAGVHLLVLVTRATREELRELLCVGVSGVALRSTTPRELAAMARRALAGERAMSPALVAVLAGVREDDLHLRHSDGVNRVGGDGLETTWESVGRQEAATAAKHGAVAPVALQRDFTPRPHGCGRGGATGEAGHLEPGGAHEPRPSRQVARGVGPRDDAGRIPVDGLPEGAPLRAAGPGAAAEPGAASRNKRARGATGSIGLRGSDALSLKERQVLACLAEGATNNEIATMLYVSPATVKSHLGHVYAKLGVSTRAGALDEASRLGLLPPSDVS